ncbi:MAG: transglycosylase domain-containing protein [Phaeodactylibacter sp.]|nr:transglycosylase domain-containing protein [Phaeodactylibacter sp.]
MKDRWINFRRRFAVNWYNFWIDYPAAGWTVKGAKFAFFLAFLAGSAFVASVAAGAFGKLPDEEDLAGVTHYVASEVYASDSTLLGRYYFENRSNVRYKDISPHFINALVATEDARFFEHNGVDLRAWARVFFKTLLRGERSSGGGSTISQQLAKNIYPREDYGKYSLVINKVKEVFIAMRLEKLYAKEELLELYLNTVPFSENTFGIKVAAQRFFNTSPARLTPSQSAVLVAMLKATTMYNPVTQPQNALARRNLVLGQMARYGYLSQRLADSLVKEPLSLNYFPITHNKGPAPYFREHLRLELKEMLKDKRKPNGMAYNIYTDGLKIYTSLNARMQHIAEEVVAGQMEDLQKAFTRHLNGADPWEAPGVFEAAIRQSARYQSLRLAGLDSVAIDSVLRIPVEMEVFSWNGGKEKQKMSPLDSIRYYLGLLNAGFLALDPKTGEVLAWVGGVNHEFFKYDHVLSTRSVGSTFKPIVYAAALQKGIPPCSYYPNQLRAYPQYEYWMPKNATNDYGGYYSLEGGLINSVNTVTVQLMMQARPSNVARLARELGISTDIPAVPAIALGAADVSLRDMVTVYSTFAMRGARPELHYIRRVESPDGTVLIDNEWQKDTCNWDHPLWEEEAEIMTRMLQAVVDRGTGRRIRYRYNMKYPLAGKTGTSQNHSDGWFIGYTPRIVAGAWVGAESPAVRFRDLSLGQGANTGLPIVAFFLQKLQDEESLNAYVNAPFPQPGPEVEQMMTCPNVVWPGKKDESQQGGEGGDAGPQTVSNEKAGQPSEATAKLVQ